MNPALRRRGLVSGLIGFLVIVVGLLLFLHALGLTLFELGHLFLRLWPLLLILLGLAFLFRRGIVGTLLLAAAFLLLVYVLLLPSFSVPGTSRTVTLQAGPADVDRVQLALTFGAGQLFLGAGDGDVLARNVITTNQDDDPVMQFTRKGMQGILLLGRNSSFDFVRGVKEEWNLSLDPDVVYAIAARYGAADAVWDLQDLQVGNLSLQTGAAKTRIRFGNYPTKAIITTGASTFHLLFPVGMGVNVSLRGRVLSSDFNGFLRQNDTYLSPGFRSDRDSINVQIRAGAASIDAGFYG
ncbi:MAG: hypothetical protein GXP63_07045 [DPANN group archaeon]|nr:hypothetical protein [DPANN group archaeon]